MRLAEAHQPDKFNYNFKNDELINFTGYLFFFLLP